MTGIGPTMAGRNGGGDLYYTDGEIWVLRLVEACRKRDGPAVTIPSPPATAAQGSDLACDRQRDGKIAPQAAIAPSKATEQSGLFAALDCFAALAMTALIEYYPAPI